MRDIILLLVFAVAATAFVVSPRLTQAEFQTNEMQRALEARDQLASAPIPAFAARFRDVARAMSPSVVNIGSRSGDSVRPVGSGVVIESDGLVLTNNHVVRDTERIVVTLSDERRFDATIVGTDPDTDLALLRIPARGLLAAELGDSDRLEVGEWVLAFGAPFGLSRTVTAGIVSATGRADVGIASYENFIQTDAAVNPGNSGGPLVDLEGRVIGINTAIASRSGGNMGVSFAIPSDMARRIVKQLRDAGRVSRGWLGVMMEDRGPGPERRVVITEVLTDQPAARGGLRSGDVILSIDGTAVANTNAMRLQIAGIDPGSTVPVTVDRSGERLRLDITLGDRLRR